MTSSQSIRSQATRDAEVMYTDRLGEYLRATEASARLAASSTAHADLLLQLHQNGIPYSLDAYTSLRANTAEVIRLREAETAAWAALDAATTALVAARSADRASSAPSAAAAAAAAAAADAAVPRRAGVKRHAVSDAPAGSHASDSRSPRTLRPPADTSDVDSDVSEGDDNDDDAQQPGALDCSFSETVIDIDARRFPPAGCKRLRTV